ncbi:MAG: hydroxymethylbilane synthase [Thermoplasmataceae archaeon]
MNLPGIKIGTRGSKLAIIQTEIAVKAINWSGMNKEIVEVKSQGDIDLVSPLGDIGGSGVFTDKLNKMVIDGELDAAIHSAKDIPSRIPEELEICMAIQGHNYKDVLVGSKGLYDIPHEGRIGTSSPRRSAELKFIRPDIEVVNIRGNIQTRFRKMEEMALDGIILAAAGLERLGVERELHELPDDIFVPSPAQGIIAVTCLKGSRISEYLKNFSEKWSLTRLRTERDCMRILGASCSQPFGILVIPNEAGYRYNICVPESNGLKYYSGQSSDVAVIEDLCRKIRDEN